MTSKTTGEEVTKASIRKRIWDHIEDEDLANFPRPVHHRIPNFKGAAEAGDSAAGLDVFKDSQTVKINPDKPQEQCRFRTLEDSKMLLVSTPRRKTGLFSQIVPPDETHEKLKICSTAQGVREFSTPIGLEDKVKIDLVIVGSVAVSEKGWRIGKGEGFADLEYAMMASMGAVDENTIIVTTVHDCQVTDIPDTLIENHDIVVDYIVTPTKVIECEHRKKPSGIIWSKITRDKLQQVPILKKLRKIEEEAGKDVTIREDRPSEDGDGRDGEKKDRRRERENRNRRGYFRQREKRQRGNRSKDSEGEGQDGEGKSSNPDSPGADDRPRRKPRRPKRRSNRTSEEGGSQGEGEDKENVDQDNRNPRRRQYRRFNNRRRRQASNRSEDGGEEGGDSEGRDSPRHGGQRRRMRRPRRFRGENDGDNKKERSSGDEDEGGEQRRRRRRRQDDNTASIFVGGLPRSVRVSEFKVKVRERGVQPLRVVWRGGNGHAFLVIENKDDADGVVKALEGLSIKDKDLRIELSNRSSGKDDMDGQD